MLFRQHVIGSVFNCPQSETLESLGNVQYDQTFPLVYTEVHRRSLTDMINSSDWLVQNFHVLVE